MQHKNGPGCPGYLSRSLQKKAILLGIGILGFLCLSLYAETPPLNPEQARARIRYAVLKDSVTVRISGSSVVTTGGTRFRVDGGEWTFESSGIRPARNRHHVFPKTFMPGEESARDAYMAEWRSRGYEPQVEIIGHRFRTAPGALLDNREYWISLARFDTEPEARTLIERLKGESVWAWTRPERISPGSGVFHIRGQGRRSPDALSAPVEIASETPIEVVDVSSSFWKERKANRMFQGPLSLEIGPEGDIEIYGLLPIETYLQGVVPAEMPAGWPAEALKAQAIVARSEIYASLGHKYRLEGFDFTALESCRAYLGLSGHAPTTDDAVRATSGMALVYGGKYGKTVFSSCCGGWTENNENVWSGPANMLLRGGPDFPSGKGGAGPSAGLNQWLSGSPPAWCAGDAAGFRWQKRYTVAELSKLVNQRHTVGTIQRIQEGPRGVSGRLKSVTITGSRGTVTIERELAIRQAFGGLPSAMVIIQASPAAGSPASFTFTGGGRGHGVGMCQHGARGMALAGRRFEEIVAQYFPGATIERTR